MKTDDKEINLDTNLIKKQEQIIRSINLLSDQLSYISYYLTGQDTNHFCAELDSTLGFLPSMEDYSNTLSYSFKNLQEIVNTIQSSLEDSGYVSVPLPVCVTPSSEVTNSHHLTSNVPCKPYKHNT